MEIPMMESCPLGFDCLLTAYALDLSPNAFRNSDLITSEHRLHNEGSPAFFYAIMIIPWFLWVMLRPVMRLAPRVFGIPVVAAWYITVTSHLDPFGCSKGNIPSQEVKEPKGTMKYYESALNFQGPKLEVPGTYHFSSGLSLRHI